MKQIIIFLTFVLSLLISQEDDIDSLSYIEYKLTLDTINSHRQNLSIQFLSDTSSEHRSRVITEAKQLFIKGNLDSIFPHWYKTPWTFNGHTENPYSGSIACGFFVTTTLRDIGLNINRIKFGRLASEYIIKNLTTENYIKRFSNAPFDRFINTMRSFKSGLFIVGLDSHVGFILVQNNDVRFIQSSYDEPAEVINEDAELSNILFESNYKVVGRISDDAHFIQKWLLSSSF